MQEALKNTLLGTAWKQQVCDDIHVSNLDINKLPQIPTLDKVIITGFEVLSISNINRLIAEKIVDIKVGQSKYIPLSNGMHYSSLTIIDEPLFDVLSQKLSRFGELKTELQITVNDPIYRNLMGYTIYDYQKRITQIQYYLLSQYGISVDFSKAKFKYLEISKTIILDGIVPEYANAIAAIMENMPSSLRLNEDRLYCSNPNLFSGEAKALETFSRSSGKRGLEVEFYDKGKELDKLNYPKEKAACSELLRFEIKLKSQNTIQRKFGIDATIWTINQTQINQYYNSFVLRNILNPYNKLSDYRIKRLTKLVKDIKQQDYHWIGHIFLRIAGHYIANGFPIMLDISELITAVKGLPDLNAKQRYAIIKSINDQASKYIPEFTKHDDKRVIEIGSKLLYLSEI